MSENEQQPETEPLSQAQPEAQAIPREPSQQAVAYWIAEQLGETDAQVVLHLVRIVGALGRTAAKTLLAETEEVEAQGGMMLPDGSRRRTKGGVYFFLAYSKGIVKRTGELLRRPPMPNRPKTPPKEGQPTTQAQPQIRPFVWDARIAIIDALMKERGTATTVKITLIGTLGNYKDQGACIVGVMQAAEKIPALPKGVPAPSAARTSYVVYIGSKQWKTIADAAKDKEDALIIEGYPQIDSQKGVISVFATSVSSKKLQSAKRATQQA